jgi:hypothetical protein
VNDKLELKEKLAAVDTNSKELWDSLSDLQKKDLKDTFFLLNRYVSSVKTSKPELQEHFILTVNEYFNKNWKDLQKHPKLLWQLLCLCSHESKNIFFHEWIGFKKKKGNNKIEKFLLEIYPNQKQDEIELMSMMYNEKDCKELARQHGYADKDIDRMFK